MLFTRLLLLIHCLYNCHMSHNSSAAFNNMQHINETLSAEVGPLYEPFDNCTVHHSSVTSSVESSQHQSTQDWECWVIYHGNFTLRISFQVHPVVYYLMHLIHICCYVFLPSDTNYKTFEEQCIQNTLLQPCFASLVATVMTNAHWYCAGVYMISASVQNIGMWKCQLWQLCKDKFWTVFYHKRYISNNFFVSLLIEVSS